MSIIRRIWDIAKTEWQSIFREPPPVFDEESWKKKKARYQTKGGYRQDSTAGGRQGGYRDRSQGHGSSGFQGSSGYKGSSGYQTGYGSGVDAVERQYRANLEVDAEAGLKDIRRAYKTLIRKYHPDLFHTEPEKRKVALEITTQLNEAMAYFEKKLK